MAQYGFNNNMFGNQRSMTPLMRRPSNLSPAMPTMPNGMNAFQGGPSFQGMRLNEDNDNTPEFVNARPSFDPIFRHLKKDYGPGPDEALGRQMAPELPGGGGQQMPTPYGPRFPRSMDLENPAYRPSYSPTSPPTPPRLIAANSGSPVNSREPELGRIPLPGGAVMDGNAAMFSSPYNSGPATGPRRLQGGGGNNPRFPFYPNGQMSQPFRPSGLQDPYARPELMNQGQSNPIAPASRQQIAPASKQQPVFPPSDRNDPNTPLGQMQAMVDRLRPATQNIQNQQQSLAQQLNRPVDRSRRAAAGVSPAIDGNYLNPANPNSYFPNRMGGLTNRMNTSEAAGVLRGQGPGSGYGGNVQPLNIPGMVFDQANNRMIPASQVPRASTADNPNAGLGGMSSNAFRYAQANGGQLPAMVAPNDTAGSILSRQQAAKNSMEVDGKQYSPADWQARAERQSLRRAYTARGGRGSAGFNRFVQGYYNQGGSARYGDSYAPGDVQAANKASYRIMRPGAVDKFGQVGAVQGYGLSPNSVGGFAGGVSAAREPFANHKNKPSAQWRYWNDLQKSTQANQFGIN